ncbi:6-carboxytetrahydropterin synthase QueD [Brumimicrobium salinarum]|uniref:6-carboxy-5,6,7,8-tetrahydropterin synthase n=1 Tax=Brumimicrobium salinarum TaxID=2058658 RepID=A0A2I0R626_9FLAO|nr:6-carboxytetrahydropterin synthase [Brumimicrobium salinarum]PKR82031.1 6-carboxytetrahydropterin synthase QueD [Brumimicrobium salinarum]
MNEEKIRVTKRFTFEMAHALYDYDGNCRYIHGHSYKLYVTIIGAVKKNDSSPKDGMVCDFSDLKKIVNENIVDVYDHALVLNQKDSDKINVLKGEQRTYYFPVQPTCENLLLHFKNTLQSVLPSELKLANIKLYETEGSYAEWDINDQ